MLSDSDIAALLELGYEQRSIEFKGAGDRTDRAFLANVARAVLALSNQRDGGHLIIGYSEDGLDSPHTGLSDEQLEQWLSFDDVVDQINAFADPPAQLHLFKANLPNGRHVVVVEVAEFAEIPILSKKDSPGRIVARRLYTRSMAKPESSESLTQNELREVIALATEKQLRRFLHTAQGAGVNVGDLKAAKRPDLFQEEYQRAMRGFPHLDRDTPLLESIIHPSEYRAARVPLEDLRRIVTSSAIHQRGWPFPWIERPRNGRDWVGERSEAMYDESWQFFQSGQFIDLRPLEKGLAEPRHRTTPADDIRGYLVVWQPIAHFTEVLEFAGRLQRAGFSTEPTKVKLALRNVNRFRLTVGDPRRAEFHRPYVYSDDDWEYEIELTPEQALLETRGIALDAAHNLMQSFGWHDASRDVLRSIQEETFSAPR